MNPERQEPPRMDHTSNVRPVFEERANLDRRPVAPSEQEHGRDRLREQLEWYLSPRNLSTDVYLVSKMNNEHWVPIITLAEFKKVKELTSSLQEVVDALRRSPVVTVDETGTMVKPITVDRPRTTLLLRELPEDTTEEEIAAVFVGAGCVAKSITKEVVGNMWFVEFDTAADALAMHNYTRGRCIKGVPIAARIKSTTVLTGGEYVVFDSVAYYTLTSTVLAVTVLTAFMFFSYQRYKAVQSTSTTMGVTSVSMAVPSPVSGWLASPSSPTFDQAAMAVSIPYRRFPANESPATQEWGPETNKTSDAVHGYSASVYPAASYSAGGFYQPVLMGPPAHSTANDGYYYNGHHAWTAVGGHGTLSPEGRPLPENLQPMFADSSCPPEAHQQKDNSAVGPRRSNYPLVPLQEFHGKFNEPRATKNNQRRRPHYDSTREGQLYQQAHYPRHFQQTPQQNHIPEHDHGLMRPRRYYPVQNSSSMHHDRSDRSSDAKSDSFSSRISGSTSSERKSKKSKSKKNKVDRQSKATPANEDQSTRDQAAGNISGSTSAPDLRSTESGKEAKEQYQNQIGRLTTKMFNVSMADPPGAARNKRKGSTAQAVRPAQLSPSLESDSFPPLPSHASVQQSDSTGDPLIQASSTPQSNTKWTRMIKGDASTMNASADAINGSARSGANDDGQPTKESRSSDPQPSLGSVNDSFNKTQPQHTAEASPVNAKAETSEQRRGPIGGMAISTSDHSPEEGTLAGVDSHKQASGVTGKPLGAFSYASALKTLQQQPQRETGPEDDADPHPRVGTAIAE
ncbi:La- protein 4 [Mortierella alpina]|uniref:La- protein 4 n=1 Tax=Mortierella alpina TaxID=64518 RepID=A0A9P6M2Z3_MORAP|nr:La- protein 4 [Mortierella alpina]